MSTVLRVVVESDGGARAHANARGFVVAAKVSQISSILVELPLEASVVSLLVPEERND